MCLCHVGIRRCAEPVVVQSFPGAQPVLRLLLQHLDDNVLCVVRDALPGPVLEAWTTCSVDESEELSHTGRFEGRTSLQQLKGHAADAPDVTLGPVFCLSRCNLRCHADWRADVALVQGSCFLHAHGFVWPVALKVELNCKTKICYLNIRVWIVGHHKDILRFQVSVHYTIGVHVMHCLEDLLDDARSVLLREMPEGHDALVDVAPVCIFHDQPHLCTRVHHLHQIHDVPMLQLPQAPYLSLEGHVTG
mmetsp:Transcript_71735/g.124437  ORF Transcript_71735/g.124437 Transcript_71735/m.124437 type:complete len:248 (+) Transcript_71735:474-1217(+)